MSDVTLRLATLDDVHLLERWDAQPHVIAAATDDADAYVAFGVESWADEILMYQAGVWEYLIAEVDGRPIGAMQIIDPHREPTGYWGEVEPNLRATDIWIGEPDCLGKGYGELMMREALRRCFADPSVTAIVIDPLASNVRAHKFYQRIGFTPTHRQTFGEDDCLVHRLTRHEWESQLR